MLDREFCLRYISFTQLDIENEYTVLDEFLNKGMDYLATADDVALDQIYFEFEYVMKVSSQLFGKFAFRRLNTEERRGPVNKSLFEAWSLILMKLSENDINILITKKSELMKIFTKLCDDYDFQNAIRSSDKTSVKSRISKIQNMVDILLGKKAVNDQ
jgi:hypothetical protein